MNAMTDAEKDADLDKMSFEQALSELESIVSDLETGNAALEDSISAYERGTALKKHCEQKLREAQAKIETISIDKDGVASTQPFETQE